MKQSDNSHFPTTCDTTTIIIFILIELLIRVDPNKEQRSVLRILSTIFISFLLIKSMKEQTFPYSSISIPFPLATIGEKESSTLLRCSIVICPPAVRAGDFRQINHIQRHVEFTSTWLLSVRQIFIDQLHPIRLHNLLQQF